MSVPALLLPYVSAETVYAVPAAALMAVLAALTVRDFRRRASDGKRTRRELTLGACGIALSAASFIAGMLLTGRDRETGEWTNDTMGWDRDMFLGYWRIALPVFCALFLILAAASLSARSTPKLKNGPMVRIRIAANLASSALFLLLTPFYAVLAANRYTPIDLLILLSGTGAALAFRLLLPLESPAGGDNSSNPSQHSQKGFSR